MTAEGDSPAAPAPPAKGLMARRLERALGLTTEIRPRLAEFETRQTALNEALAEFATRFELLLTRLGRRQNEVVAQLVAHEQTAQAISDDLSSAIARIDELASAVPQLKSEIDRLSRLIEGDRKRAGEALAQLEAIRSDVNVSLGRLDALDGALASVLERLGQHDAEAERVAGRLSDFDRDFARIDRRLVELNERDEVARQERSVLSRRVEDVARQSVGAEVSGLYRARGAGSSVPGEPLTVFISSYGRTATYWLAQVLNAHPDVIASHGPTTPPIVEYADETPVETDLFVWDNMDSFFALTLDQAVADMRKLGAAKLYVKVHSYSAYNLYNRILAEDYAKPLGMANVLRHPVTRADSFARRWRANAKTNPKMKKFMIDWWNASPDAPGLVRALEKAERVDFANTDDMFFAMACLWLRQDREDLTVPILHVPSERLVEDIDYFAWFARQITDGRLALSRDYLDRVQQTGPKNIAGQPTRGALETWEDWAPWQRTAFRYAAELYGLRSLYGRLPYDLGFVV